MTVYPFVPARWYTPGGLVEARAILWHMAEGYSTVEYLTHPRVNVSAHFVIERSGEIVQMVGDDDAAHSAHIAIDPDDSDASDCGGLYSDAIARRVLGLTGWADVNAYVVAVEVEGFRAEGPNLLQSASIEELYHELRSRHRTIRGNLGHRDVQDYKSCPGCRFPWARIGGHGPTGDIQGSDDMAIQLPARLRSDYKLDLKLGTPWWLDAGLEGKPAATISAPVTVDYHGAVIGEASRAVRLVTGRPYGDKVPRPTLVYVRTDAGVPYYVDPSSGVPPSDPAAETLEPGLYRVP